MNILWIATRAVYTLQTQSKKKTHLKKPRNAGKYKKGFP